MREAKPTLVNIVHSLDPGGAERLVVDMSRAFADDYDVHVFCLDSVGEWADGLRSAGVPVRELRRQPGLDLYLAWRIAKLLRQVSADIVHAHQTAPWFYSALARLFYRKPKLLFEEHGRHFPEPDRRWHRLANRLLVGRLTHVSVAVSRDIRERLVRYEGLRRDRIRIIYNGGRSAPAPDAATIQILRAEFGFDAGHKIVGFVGRLDPVKNIKLLIDAFAELKASHADLRCLIVGDGPERDELQTKVARHGLTAEFVFAGYRSDADRLVHCMDMFVLPSLSEGTSMALLEAMSAGVPAVVTNVGGNIELIEDGVSGYVVESDSVAEMAGALRELISDPQLASQRAESARQKFSDKFSFDAMISAYGELYRELM
jgi:sugar transferase (PEP-CTERM/EpsH1 system associated)